MTPTLRTISALGTVALLMACTPEPTEPDTSVAHGKMLFAQKCAVCHGEGGAGLDASEAGVVTPDLTTLSAQNRGIYPRDYVMSVIDGFNRRSHPNSVMPEFGNEDLGPLIQVEDGGTTTPTPSDLIALSAYVESIQK